MEDEELVALLEENTCHTLLELGQELGVTPQAISKRLHKLGKIQKESRWVPHELTTENKNKRFDVVVSLLSRFKKKDFLYKIVTCDEKWILYGNPKRRKSMVHRDYHRGKTEEKKVWEGILKRKRKNRQE